MSIPSYADLARALGEFHRAYNADGNPAETIADLERADEVAADLASRAPIHVTPESVMRDALADLVRGHPSRAAQRLRTVVTIPDEAGKAHVRDEYREAGEEPP